MQELVEIIRQVRRRWRLKQALRGTVGVLGLGVLALVAAAYGLEAWRFTASFLRISLLSRSSAN